MVKKMPVTPRPAPSAAKMEVATSFSPEAISHRAYGLFQARGSEHGHDVEDWLVAEADLLNVTNTEIPSPVAKT
jgi:hypothetical protein